MIIKSAWFITIYIFLLLLLMLLILMRLVFRTKLLHDLFFVLSCLFPIHRLIPVRNEFFFYPSNHIIDVILVRFKLKDVLVVNFFVVLFLMMSRMLAVLISVAASSPSRWGSLFIAPIRWPMLTPLRLPWVLIVVYRWANHISRLILVLVRFVLVWALIAETILEVSATWDHFSYGGCCRVIRIIITTLFIFCTIYYSVNITVILISFDVVRLSLMLVRLLPFLLFDFVFASAGLGQWFFATSPLFTILHANFVFIFITVLEWRELFF